MRNFRYKKLLLSSLAALTVFACGEDVTNDSHISSFEKFPVTMTGSTTTVSELAAGEYDIDFVLDERQMFDVTLVVGVGNSSTATEGVDFDIVTHEVELDAYQGQDGFSVTIEVHEDYIVEAGDEDIYLVFTSTLPNGVEMTETKVITIEDSGLVPVAATTADFTLRWEYADEEVNEAEDACDIDMDMTFQTAGGAPYDDDLLGYGAAGSSCPEHGELTLADMNDGEVYDVWFIIYGGIDLGALVDHSVTVYVDFERENTDFNGTIKIPGIFKADMAAGGAGAPLLTIERNGDVLTVKDLDGGVRAEGRISTSGIILQPVTKKKI